MNSRLLAVLVLLAGASSAIGQDAPLPDPPPLPPLSKPSTTAMRLDMLDAVVKQAEEYDLLDDQEEEVEALLEKMDDACHDERFDDALEHGRAVHRILATNK
jgi:hypothetical protein